MPVIEVLNFFKKIVPFLHNENPETRFDLSAALNLALIGLLSYFLGIDNTQSIVEIALECSKGA